MENNDILKNKQDGNSCSKEEEIETRKRLIVQLWRSDLSAGLSGTVSGEDDCEVDSDDLDSSIASTATKRPRSSDDERHSEESTKSSKISTSRRGRGRPPTSGKYIGVGKARAELAAARREELEAARREYLERSAQEDLVRYQAVQSPVFRQPRPAPEPRKEAEECTALELDTRLQGALLKIQNVGQVSKGLKGTCIRDLKEAVATIREVGEVFKHRTPAQEVALLKRENTRLASQVEELRQELADLKKELREGRNESRSIGSQEPVQSTVTRLMGEMEARITARLAVLEGIRLRPPLAGKETYATMAAENSKRGEANSRKAAAAQTTKTVPAKAQTIRKGEEKKPTKVNEKTATQDKEWHTVGNKKAATKNKKAKNKETKKKAASSKPPKKLRIPKSSAVVITLQPTAQEKGISYAQILRKAKDKIDLSELGISTMRLKQARTGARLLELPGASTSDKADALATKLKNIFGADEVRVSRPTKCADIRLTGFDDSVGPMEIHEAVVKAGNTSPAAIKVGQIRRRGRNGTGLGTVVVNCPVSVAQKIADSKRINIGWVAVQVKLLPPRPAKCFKCFADGHVAVQCTSNVDLTKSCFRCGEGGHLARDCSAPPHCAICAAAGKQADHRVGTKTCSPSKTQRREATTSSHVAAVDSTAVRSTTEGVAMES